MLCGEEWHLRARPGGPGCPNCTGAGVDAEADWFLPAGADVLNLIFARRIATLRGYFQGLAGDGHAADTGGGELETEWFSGQR